MWYVWGKRTWPLRLRLTACFLLAFGALLVGIEWLDERALSALLDRVSREDLAIKIAEVQSAIKDSEPASQLPNRLTLDGTMVEIVAPSGKILCRTANLRGEGLPRPDRSGIMVVPAGRNANGPVMVGTASLGPRWDGLLALVGIPLDEFEAAKAHKRLSGTIALVVGLALSGIVGYGLSGLALRPVERMRQDVSSIEAENMARRIAVDRLPRDELGRLATTFNELLDGMVAAREKQRRFVEDASHDLKSPVTAIRGHAQLLLKRGRQDPQLWERPLKAILRETERMVRLVDDLLLIADPSRDHESICPIDMATFVQETVGDRELLHAPVRLGRVEPCTVLMAPDQLRRILNNLLDNAIRAVDGGGAVEVTVLAGDGHVKLLVSDTGTGILEADRSRVFDRFYRSDSARAKDRGGSGLGLAIVKSLAEYHGGRTYLESNNGHGTVVVVELPLESQVWQRQTASEIRLSG
ncbi:MAG: HAMP domain-containing protein [Cyanobacteria bacterium NC_groundwater_1444_Ag_S-0.65um_54_12]|nr:HAMP domain-containing protein [Cyanobacteria bacterium NC_groundwater_1444_Ag_S-0.65um_54_12]